MVLSTVDNVAGDVLSRRRKGDVDALEVHPLAVHAAVGPPSDEQLAVEDTAEYVDGTLRGREGEGSVSVLVAPHRQQLVRVLTFANYGPHLIKDLDRLGGEVAVL